MSKQDNLTDFLTDVADAIREKKGTTDLINPQDFSSEIKNLPSGGSPFAVDFGEEIASGNPAYIGALQEDIDYYNEIQRKLAAGEVTDIQLRDDMDFRERIAWLSSPYQYSRSPYAVSLPFINLREFRFPNFECSGYYTFLGVSKMEYAEFSVYGTRWDQMFERCVNLKRYKIHTELKPTTVDNMFFYCHSLEEVDVDCSEVTTAANMLQYCYSLRNVNLSFPLLKGSLSGFLLNCKAKSVVIDIPNVTGLSLCFRSFYCESLHLNIPSVTTNNYSLMYNSPSNTLLKDAYISGLQVRLYLENAPNVTVDSIKYICDHCQAREDGAAYTVTLHKDVLARFMVKCTEGHEEYDAEYAASLASANEKGLTLA